MRERAVWIIDNLTVAHCLQTDRSLRGGGEYRWHAIHPGTDEAFCVYGRKAKLYSHKPAVPEDVTCYKCRRIVMLINRIAEGE